VLSGTAATGGAAAARGWLARHGRRGPRRGLCRACRRSHARGRPGTAAGLWAGARRPGGSTDGRAGRGRGAVRGPHRGGGDLRPRRDRRGGRRLRGLGGGARRRGRRRGGGRRGALGARAGRRRRGVVRRLRGRRVGRRDRRRRRHGVVQRARRAVRRRRNGGGRAGLDARRGGCRIGGPSGRRDRPRWLDGRGWRRAGIRRCGRRRDARAVDRRSRLALGDRGGRRAEDRQRAEHSCQSVSDGAASGLADESRQRRTPEELVSELAVRL
jgi:hypothetical protein